MWMYQKRKINEQPEITLIFRTWQEAVDAFKKATGLESITHLVCAPAEKVYREHKKPASEERLKKVKNAPFSLCLPTETHSVMEYKR